MKTVTLGDLLTAVQGELRGEFQDLSTEICDVTIDSRKVKSHDVFFALIGERFDAHDFVGEIQEVAGFVISKEMAEYANDKFYLKVEDTEKALGDFAKWYRSWFHIPFLAVTGSVGKTTAKDMISSVLSTKYKVHKTQGNFNNTIGLPLTILQLEEHHEICVLEMGMDTAGEIDYMGRIVEPDLAIITNTGEAHIERLGSRENIKKAKYEILPHLSKGGYFLRDLEMNDVIGVTMKKLTTEPEVEHGDLISRFREVRYTATYLDSDGFSKITCAVVGNGSVYDKVNIPALGQHMFYPTLFAIVVGQIYDLSKEEILEGISQFVPTKMRMDLVKLDQNITIMDDCYNANPQSMRASLAVLADYHCERKVAILGDMLELGEFSQGLHQDIGEFVSEHKIHVLIAIGTEAKYIAQKAKEMGNTTVHYCQTKEDALPVLDDLKTRDVAFLVKASRGMELESIVDYLKNQYK